MIFEYLGYEESLKIIVLFISGILGTDLERN